MGISVAILASTLQQCIASMSFVEGKIVHHHLVMSHGTSICVDLLIKMYCVCWALRDAVVCLTSLQEASTSVWNRVIKAHIQKDDNKGAITLFELMQHKGVTANEFTFVFIFSALHGLSDSLLGRWAHAYLCECGFDTDIHVGTSLIKFYGMSGSVADARHLFVQMPRRDLATWNTLISVYTCHGMQDETFQLFARMVQQGLEPNRVTFIGMLDAFYCKGAIDEGRLLHAFIMESTLNHEIIVTNALLNMYGKFGALEDAKAIFGITTNHNVVSWTTMISGFALHGMGNKAIHFFVRMLQANLIPDSVTFVTVLDVCADCNLLLEGKLLHAFIICWKMEGYGLIGNSIVNMYGNCSSLKDASKTFNQMQVQDVVAWTALISAYTQQEGGQQAIDLLKRMQLEGVKPNKITFVCVLDACAKKKALSDGFQVHVCILESKCMQDDDLRISLINMYGKCGNLKHSWDIFKGIPEPNVITWTTMITVYSYCGLAEEALELCEDMHKKGVLPNAITLVAILEACIKCVSFVKGKQVHACLVNSLFELDVRLGNALINFYGRCHDLHLAYMVFRKLAEPNVISWTSMIMVYTSHGKAEEAILQYESLQRQGVKPDRATFLCILDACVCCVNLAKGEQVLHEFVASGFELDHAMKTALINLYGKCGYLNDARRLFEGLGAYAVVSWTVMISLYALHGQCEEAINLFNDMQLDEITPDELTYVGILSACSHAGLVDEGQHLFCAMIKKHGIYPSIEHYVCMVDLYGRAGCLDEAEEFLTSRLLQPTGELLMAFLGACRYRGDILRAKQYAEKSLQVDPANSAPYVMLWNIFSADEKEGDTHADIR